MLSRLLVFLVIPAALWGAAEWVSIRTTDGVQLEGQTTLRAVPFEQEGVARAIPLTQLLSVHNGVPASEFEAGQITKDIAAIQSGNRVARDRAVEELTAIGVPVMTPLLQAYKDTDQHEPRPLYRLFERVMPSYADGLDRTLAVVRLATGDIVRGRLADAMVEMRSEGGQQTTLPWSKIRALAVRRKTVHRTMQAHALQHSTQIEYLDTGVGLSSGSKVDLTARGFVRVSWDEDSWASDADGLKKPGARHDSNLVDGFPYGALVGRIGAGGAVFLVGKNASITGKPAGRLGLAVNDNNHWQNNIGSFTVTMTATDAYDLGDAQ